MKKTLIITVSIIAILISLCFVRFFKNRTSYEPESDSKNFFEIKGANERTQSLKISEFQFKNDVLSVCIEYVGNNYSVPNLKNIELKMFNLNDGKKEEIKVHAKYVMYKDIVPANMSGVREMGILNPLKSFSELAAPLDVFKNDSTINYCFTVLNEYDLKNAPKKIELQLDVISNSSVTSFTSKYNLHISKSSISDIIQGTKLKDLKY
ncbi:MAG: hypothetical protein V4565_05990 [Bacteroidota bacterium]